MTPEQHPPGETSLPSITVITVCLNAAATISETLASVREQSYPHVEHLVVDGGSTDGTLEILERAEAIRYVSEPDDGLADAMNKGARLADGDVIAWLHADDLYRPGALQRAGAAFAAHPGAEWVVGRCPIVDARGEEIRRGVTAYKNLLLRRYSYRLLLTQNFVSNPSTFVSRRAFHEAGGLDERFKHSLDYDLWLRLGRRGDPVVVNADLAVFRMAPGSLSMQGFERQFAEHAANAREHGADHRGAVAVNAVMSRSIVAIYRGLRLLRGG